MKTFYIVCLLAINAVVAQTDTVRGTVVNRFATPVPSARIEWKQQGMVTGVDSSGTFRIPLSTIVNDELRISAYGYNEITLGRSAATSPLTITLSPQASLLQLVVADIPKGMKPVTGGTFQMGNDANMEQVPVHTVRVSSFWIDSTEVTVADFDAFMKSYSWYPGLRSGIAAGDRIPLSMVSFYEAALYCNARSRRDHLDTVYSYTSLSLNGPEVVIDNCTTGFGRNGYRLPTEAEWEYACRGLAPTRFYWGNSVSSEVISRYAVCAKNIPNVQMVATKTPNAFGIYDMIGNVMERTNDREGGYPDSVQINPTGAKTGEWNVVRGNAFNADLTLTSGDRSSAGVGVATYQTGFRVVLRDTARIPMLSDPHVVNSPSRLNVPSVMEAMNPATVLQTRVSLCTKGHPVAFRYRWGDGDTSAWLGGSYHNHTYRDSGIYQITVQARCTADTTLVSEFTSADQVIVSGVHHVIPAPVLTGPSQGTAGVSYSFEGQPAVCNKGHKVNYFYSWGDGFTSEYTALKKSHVWSQGGTYHITAFAKCEAGIASDTSSTSITIAAADVPASANAYRSRFFSFFLPSAKGDSLSIDFSDSSGNLGDVFFAGYSNGNFIVRVPYGAYDLGSIKIPNFPEENELANMDSLVSCMRIVVPENGFECCSTTSKAFLSGYQAAIVKTSEGRYGLLILYRLWGGGLDHYVYYLGYQSDGNRQFSPNAKCAAALQMHEVAASSPSRIGVVMAGSTLTVTGIAANPSGALFLYDVRGRLVKQKSVSGVSQAKLDLSLLPAGFYLVKVSAGKQEFLHGFVRAH